MSGGTHSAIVSQWYFMSSSAWALPVLSRVNRGNTFWK